MKRPAGLIELSPSLQHTGEPLRRWFTSDSMDLIVWLDATSAVQAFQLCYGKSQQEYALEWRRPSGFSHFTVDDGSVADPGHKRTPVMLSSGALNVPLLLKQLNSAGSSLPNEILRAVEDRLLEFKGGVDE